MITSSFHKKSTTIEKSLTLYVLRVTMTSLVATVAT